MTAPGDILREEVAAGRQFTEAERQRLFEMLDWTDAQQRMLLTDMEKMRSIDKWQTWGLCAMCFLLGWVFARFPS